jgi:PAS domain S-box-containing protein
MRCRSNIRNQGCCRHLLQESSASRSRPAQSKVNRELKEQLARAFGLGSDADVEALIARLRAGEAVDVQTLRQGCLALVDNVREARDAHAVSDQRLQIALEASNLALWDWDIASGQVFVDRTFSRLIGRGDDSETWQLSELQNLVCVEDREPFTAAVHAALKGDSPMFEVSYRVRHADGRWVWIETYGNVTARDANGRATRMTGTHANITDRKQMERALSNTLRVMQTLLETMPLPIIIRDAECRVTMVNAAWEQMVGVSRQHAIGKQLHQIANRPPTAHQRETDDRVLRDRQALRFETTVHARDGTPYNVIVAKTPLLNDDGHITGIASVVTDISEQKRTAAVLERARLSAENAVQAKSRFLANMSHELRTPLNGVVGMASLLENTALDAKQRRFVRTLRSSAEALITLINDVLDLSKAEAGKLELNDAPFELRREIEQVVGLFTGRACDRGIEIAAHIARDVPAVMHGDAMRLRQVLGNLVNNAVKFTEAGAVLLAVKVLPDEQRLMLEFSVTDTGVGVAAEEQKRIFEAFEQADGSVTRKFGGTGLGLAISRQLVELMHGSMGLSSEPGSGSRFSFVIPAGVPRVESPPPKLVHEVGTLVIGMHPVIRSAVCDTLSAESAHVISVDSPLGAIEALQDFGPKITRIRVVLDSNAAANVEQAVAGLRAAAGPRQVEVIALMPADADSAPPQGVNRSLVKPVCTPDLLTSIATVDPAQSMTVRVLPMSGSRGRALVVEDNAVNQEMARAMLDMLGFEVITAGNGQEGVNAAAAHPDLTLILMDCQMPVMDGLAAARAIRAAEPAGQRVPIVALTGNAMPGDREACVAAGMDDYLAKPFSLTALRATLDRWAPAAVGQPGKALARS